VLVFLLTLWSLPEAVGVAEHHLLVMQLAVVAAVDLELPPTYLQNLY
jgi:hypothetical protein